MAQATAYPEGLATSLADVLADPRPAHHPARYLDSPLSFDQWMRRPVYVAQCRTWAAAKAMGVCCDRFRALPCYRDSQARQARKLVADMMRKERQRITL